MGLGILEIALEGVVQNARQAGAGMQGAKGQLLFQGFAQGQAQMQVGIEHAHDPGPVGAGLAVHDGGIFDLVEHLDRVQHLVFRRRFAGGDGEIDEVEAEIFAGLALQHIEAGLIAAASQIDHSLHPMIAPPFQLERPGLVGADQVWPDPVGVLEPHAQIGVVLPQQVQIGFQAPQRRGEIETGHGRSVVSECSAVTVRR